MWQTCSNVVGELQQIQEDRAQPREGVFVAWGDIANVRT